ncbi:hypothetical protein Zmor_011467 [Zophobas morio]|uniref:Uncharacterized protein n=1 Tax=Zophobas morio TaxID=2755281 RepID=A0AA38MKX8_9CUCU|nr:hypothetical protein Zmor_011467 [Zophobas morio]
MHKLGHLLVLGAGHESLHETPAPSARPRQTNHLRLHTGRSQEARDDDLRAARFPQELSLLLYSIVNTLCRPVKLGNFSRYLIQKSLNNSNEIHIGCSILYTETDSIPFLSRELYSLSRDTASQ